MRKISARICTRSFASRFESGSSMRKTWGSRTIARPIATRCRWPPESCARLAVEVVAEADDLRRLRDPLAASAFGTLRMLQREPDVLGNRHVRIERVVLEHHRDIALARREVVDDRSPILMSPSLISSRPAIMRNAVVLPQPDGPTKTTNSPSCTSRFRSETARVPSS